jgi:quinoprotein dehydrogenase-associated probable ABC transporter substrate-binding protein
VQANKDPRNFVGKNHEYAIKLYAMQMRKSLITNHRIVGRSVNYQAPFLTLAARWFSSVFFIFVVFSVDAAEREYLKVCAPPGNLPMSDRSGHGYENRIAELFAKDLGLKLTYEWFPQRLGFIRNTLRFDNTPDGQFKCDIVMGVIDNFEMAATTDPYLHSSWALVYVRGRGLDFIKTQDDLKELSPERKSRIRVGVWDKGPAPKWFYHRGLMENSTPYQIMSGDIERNAGQIIAQDLVEDKINLTMVWGPIAGYYAKLITAHDVVVIPMRNELRVKFNFQIAMAVRHGEDQWKSEINQLIKSNSAKIRRIMDDYGVPQLKLVTSENRND